MSRLVVLLRVAWFLSRQRTAASRWRTVSVGLAAVVFSVAVGTAVSLTSATASREAVAARRVPVLAADQGLARLRMLEYGPVVEGRQFPLYWVEAVGAGGLLPPGVDALPDPGSVIVSPALLALGEAELESRLGLPLTRRGGVPVTIGERGLASPGELVAYASPPAGRGIRSAHAVGVTAFGGGAAESPIGLGYPPDKATSVFYGTLVLLVLPALYLLWICLGSASPVRDRRLALLHEQGISRRAARLLVFLESLLLAVPGTVLGVLVWAFAVTNLAGVRAAGIPFFSGDLEVGPGWPVGTAVVGAVLAGALGALQAARPAAARRRSPRHIPNQLRLLPVYVSLAALVAVHFARYPFAARLWYGGLLLAAISFPPALPVVVQWVGRVSARMADPERWLAGKRLVHHSASLARPALTIGAFVLVGTVGTAIAARTLAPGPAGSDPPVVYLGWPDPGAQDVRALRAALPDLAVLVVSESADGNRIELVASSCADLLPIATASRCDAVDAIPPGAAEVVASTTARAPISGVLSVAPGAGGDATDGVLVIGRPTSSGEDVYERLLPAAHRALGPSNLAGGAFPQYSERPRRVGAGVAVSAVVLLLSALQMLGERSIGLSAENTSLAQLGAGPRYLRRVTFLQIALPSGAAAAFGGALGIAFAVAGTDIARPETAVIWPVLLGEVVAVIALAVALAALVARVSAGRD